MTTTPKSPTPIPNELFVKISDGRGDDMGDHIERSVETDWRWAVIRALQNYPNKAPKLPITILVEDN